MRTHVCNAQACYCQQARTFISCIVLVGKGRQQQQNADAAKPAIAGQTALALDMCITYKL